MALSFTVAEVSRKGSKDLETYYARLSNGPMESFNRKPKDYKRNARGTSNFDYTRNRIWI
nr:transposase [Dubosiella newyorkensis]